MGKREKSFLFIIRNFIGVKYILVREAHLLGVAELVQVGDAGKVDHGRRPTHQHLDIRD